MFINTGKVSLLYAARLPGSGVQYFKKYTAIQPFHTTAAGQNYVDPAPLPLPINVDAAETTRFSPQRSRDISATVIMAQAPISTIDITTDNSYSGSQGATVGLSPDDPHVQSYDCFGAVSLNSVMQSNVPQPFGGMHKFSHLNMPGGQWSQEFKFTSQNMQSSHYRALRDNYRADWVTYDQNATLNSGGGGQGFSMRRNFSTERGATSPTTTPSAAEAPGTATSAIRTEASTTPESQSLSKKEQLKRAFKEYGATIVVFHVGLSLMSLGGFYVLVNSGINFVPILEYLGIESSAIGEKLATGSTFVVAYAVHKVFAPLRISITLGATPFIVRYLRAKGFMKPKIKGN